MKIFLYLLRKKIAEVWIFQNPANFLSL
uniref:Uncharacterized 3.3 kDa protein in rpl11-trnW intergenic region n=1 Tax=Trieres chinensis TaxID=1514140 RepID=YCXA_TRICV|nr:ORF27 [Trieres chinensis]P49836.1 RecName: Full=Uncharacterized 3.3 kDa protein in rpl11-trnW intergenic region; AltName: Full=ORF27 [Trieres chinensis]CAA91728.1 ORF27 [Trieres chinensis]